VSGLFRRRQLLGQPQLGSSYDVVIVGGGVHGLATAFYLASRFGITDVAVLERSYIGSGGSGRNTQVIRANYNTPESVRFYRESVHMYRSLTQELDFNILYSEQGEIDLVHGEDALRVERERVALNRSLGVDTVLLTPAEIKAMCPLVDLHGGGDHPVVGASYHAPGATARHDSVVWGFAQAARRLGAEIHQGIGVERVLSTDDRCIGVLTTGGGVIHAGTVVLALGGYSSILAGSAGFELPLVTHPLQAFVTEPYRHVLDHLVSSFDPIIYVSQTQRGELVVGAEIEPYASYSTASTFGFLTRAATRCIAMLPFMAGARVMRQWTGICDMTPDSSPIMGPSPLPSLLLTAGWGTWGFKAAPIGGLTMAELIATGRTPSLIEPFALDRFERDRMVADAASAGTH
jgi:sarcosine oxidase subunit beta